MYYKSNHAMFDKYRLSKTIETGKVLHYPIEAQRLPSTSFYKNSRKIPGSNPGYLSISIAKENAY